MREHEVPTHLQAEDKVLLWFTFPQLVAITAGGRAGLRGVPLHPRGILRGEDSAGRHPGAGGNGDDRGKVGGRQLPLVAADLLKYRLGARRYAGPPAQLVRPEPPAPVQAASSPLALMAKNARRIMRRRNGRMPLPSPTAGSARAAGAVGRARTQNRTRRRPREARTGGNG